MGNPNFEKSKKEEGGLKKLFWVGETVGYFQKKRERVKRTKCGHIVASLSIYFTQNAQMVVKSNFIVISIQKKV